MLCCPYCVPLASSTHLRWEDPRHWPERSWPFVVLPGPRCCFHGPRPRTREYQAVPHLSSAFPGRQHWSAWWMVERLPRPAGSEETRAGAVETVVRWDPRSWEHSLAAEHWTGSSEGPTGQRRRVRPGTHFHLSTPGPVNAAVGEAELHTALAVSFVTLRTLPVSSEGHCHRMVMTDETMQALTC